MLTFVLLEVEVIHGAAVRRMWVGGLPREKERGRAWGFGGKIKRQL